MTCVIVSGKYAIWRFWGGVGRNQINNNFETFNSRYSTPLHDAVCCGRQEVVKILVSRGAAVNELDYKNMTPLKLAIRYVSTCCMSHVLFVRYGQEDIEQLLRSKGAKETVEIPKKVSVAGEVDPPWVRRSSRREQMASL